jgi:hypothetical protein
VIRKKQYLSLSLVLALGLCLQGFSQERTYTVSVAKGLKILDTAKNSGFAKAAEQFTQITKTEQKEWLPYYYAALSDILVAFQKKGREIDTWCDKADLLISKADSLKGDASEILVLRSMSASARINVNVLGRGQKYGGLALSEAEQAIKANPANPRAYLQKGTAIHYTPELFGGGAKKAKPVLDTALEKYKAAKPASKLSPAWGLDRARELLKDINSKINQPKK